METSRLHLIFHLIILLLQCSFVLFLYRFFVAFHSIGRIIHVRVVFTTSMKEDTQRQRRAMEVEKSTNTNNWIETYYEVGFGK